MSVHLGGKKSTTKMTRYIDVLCSAVEAGDKKKLSIRLIQKKAGVGYSTAAKIWDVMSALNWLETPDKRTSKVVLTKEDKDKLILRSKSIYVTSYSNVGTGEILEEDAKKFKEVRKKFDYFADLVLPALKVGLNYGSVSPTILQRKLGLDSLRAEEIYDVMDAMGYLGDVDENVDSRRVVLISAKQYDELALRYQQKTQNN